MKSTVFKKTGKASKKNNSKLTFSKLLRSAKRGSGYAFAATLGIWLPRTEAATLINIDATTQAVGPLATWPNTGTVVGDFTSSGSATPEVVSLDGVNAVALTNDVGTAAGAAGLQYVGPATPGSVCTNNPRTVEAWIWDVGGTNSETAAGEKVIFGWGRRVSPGLFVLEHGWDRDNGAVNINGGGPGGLNNVGWNGEKNIVTNKWTYIVATYDGATLKVYSDGVLRNSRSYIPVAPLNTFSIGSDNATLLQFRVGRQNLNGAPTGSASGAGIAPFYAGRIRVQDTAMTAAQVLTQYDSEKAAFNIKDTDGDGIEDWYEIRYGLNPNANDASADPDGDGATNLEEFNAGSNPNVADTDGDGISDGTELHRTDPQTTLAAPTSPILVDTDGDGLSDAAETDNGTTTSDPLKADTDGDGFGDGMEVAKGSNPLNAGSVPTPLINLDATALSAGPLAVWTNSGSVVGDFNSVSATNRPSVTNIDGVMGVNFTTVAIGGSGGRNGTSYFGPAVPAQITGAGLRTAAMWVFNRTVQDEETMLSWGARGGDAPDGKNVSFGEGRNAAFGAVAQWGGFDIGWDNQEVYGRWVHLAYTYDGATTRVYRDGELANKETLALITLANSANPADGTPYRFPRIARQNQNFAAAAPASGFVTNIDTTGAGEFTVSRIQVYDVALSDSEIKARFDAEKATFGVTDTDGDGMPDWYETRHGLNKNSAADAALDPDGDGLTNLQEYQQNALQPNAGTAFTIGTNPNLADSDADGLNDGAELSRLDTGLPNPPTGANAPTNPLNRDTDGDGLLDGVETDTGIYVSVSNTGSDPLRTDTDGDGFSDGLEVAQGSDPDNINIIPSPLPIVNLDFTTNTIPLGPLTVQTNKGRLGGNFVAEAGGGTTNSGGTIETVQGVRGLTLSGGAYQGTNATFVTGNPNYSVEAWVYNPAMGAEESIIGWGRRGGGDGTMSSLNDGSSVDFGAMTHWGAPDLGWNNANVRTPPRWKHLVFTYDAASRTQTVYSDGVQANQEVLGAPLVIADSLDGGVTHLPFRLGNETAGDGTPGGFAFTGTVGEVRVFTRTLPVSEIVSNFNAGALKYGILDDDGDGMPTWFERVYGFNPNNAADGPLDFDGDGLSNSGEYNSGNNSTDPTNPDSDGDGLTDGQEVNVTSSNPNNPDTDLDGLTDNREVALGTSPLTADTDGDSFPDGIEVLYGTNPNDALSTPDLSTPRPFVNLDATTLPLGPLASWTNNNALGTSFKASTNILGVSVVDGTKGVTFDGTDYYTGPNEPSYLSGNAARTVVAWVWNPTAAGEETVFAWGRRGGNPDGSNMALSHGIDPVFGAAQHWGSPDVPWGSNASEIASNVVTGHWTFIAMTYDPTTVTDTVYKDGVAVHTESVTNAAGASLATFLYDPSDPLNTGTPIGRSLRFRVGAQNDPGGANASVPFATMTIAKIRAYDQTLSALQIANQYNTEKVQFPGQPVITNVKVDIGTGLIRFDWVPAPTKTYAVETNTDLTNPGGWAAEATGQSSGSYTNNAGGVQKYYRLRVE